MIEPDLFAQKIRQFIISSSGRSAEEASKEEFYFAFVQALREEIMIHWAATQDTWAKKKPRTLHYLSMEYLPGRLLPSLIHNRHATGFIQKTLSQFNRPLSDLLACDAEPGLGNGGLGRLASCFFDSLANADYPAIAYGLRFQYGVFEQEIWNGHQVERPDNWLLQAYPWEVRKDSEAVQVHFRGSPEAKKNSQGDEVYDLTDFEEVRALPFDIPIVGCSKKQYSVIPLRLWSTKESPRNFQLQRFNAGFLDQASENTSLVDVLYPNDQTEIGRWVRLKQELLLASASVQDIVRRHLRLFGDLKLFADKTRIQINDTHPAIAVVELIRILMKEDFSWKDAQETALTCCSYTNHTILREALEEWNEGSIFELMPRQFTIIQRLNAEFCQKVRKKFPQDEEKVRQLSIIENGRIRMAHLAIWGSHKVNGVAALHTEILKTKVFPLFYEMFPERFVNVTNGINQWRWLNSCNPRLSDWIGQKIGKSFLENFSQIEKLASLADKKNDQEEFLAIKRKNKEALLHFLATQNPIRDAKGQIISYSPIIDPSALIDVHIKRFHEYKRQLLNALHLIVLYGEIKKGNTRIKRQSLFSGKAAASYIRAKQIMLLISAIARKVNHDMAVKDHLRVVFVENYNVSKAEIIMPAADLSEQISTAGWEASGTGNMKLAMNGALTIGTEDGANIEMRKAIGDEWWPFRFGAAAAENEQHPGRGAIDERLNFALESLVDGSLAESFEEKAAFAEIHHDLLHHDRFGLLRDFPSYYDTQKKVEDLYRQPARWAETAIHNIAGMGSFSSDVSIHNYVQKIWQIESCPIDSNRLLSSL